MDIWQFFDNHTFLAFIVICSIYYTIRTLIVILPNRILRHINIRKHGYPPIHCDADGDFKQEIKE